jgi:signal transduction histidine kinase
MLPATLPLAIRRRFPLAVAVTVVAAVALQQVIVDLEDSDPSTALLLSPLVALYTMGAHCSGRRALIGACVSALIAAIADTVILGAPSGLDIASWSVFVAIPSLSGRAVRLHRRQAQEVATLAARLERERDARARLAVIEERTRVARELHDAIAHGVSVMVLQACAAEQVLASDAAQARQAAGVVEDTGRAVLDELRQLLGVLRSDEDDSPRRPRPSLDDLDALLAQVRDAGLPVDLEVHGERVPLPAGLDVSAYRVIQEGLTNALKHAGPVPTAVSLDYQPEALILKVVNMGAPVSARSVGGPGHGLIGMRERVALCGGALEAGPRPTGGYALRVRLPLEGDGA